MEAESPPPSDDVIAESAPLIGEGTVIENCQQAECAQTLPAVNDGIANGANSTDATSSDIAAGVSTAGLMTDAVMQQSSPASTTTPSIRTYRHGGALPR
jgi:hypothetical protein